PRDIVADTRKNNRAAQPTLCGEILDRRSLIAVADDQQPEFRARLQRSLSRGGLSRGRVRKIKPGERARQGDRVFRRVTRSDSPDDKILSADPQLFAHATSVGIVNSPNVDSVPDDLHPIALEAGFAAVIIAHLIRDGEDRV